jgi:hypothetical protein
MAICPSRFFMECRHGAMRHIPARGWTAGLSDRMAAFAEL